MKKVKLSSPWVTFYRELNALFEADPDVSVEYKEGDKEIRVFVKGSDKADAIAKILPVKKDFGNVTIHIAVMPTSKKMTKLELYKQAFAGNPAFSFAVSVGGLYTNPVNYVVFRNKVVQFWNDNLGDVNGNSSMLFEDCARNVFGDDDILYCTDEPENLGMVYSTDKCVGKEMKEVIKIDD